jgi:membrane protease YdiL (CAAX protease family)
VKDVAKLAVYFIGIVVIGTLLAPMLFWSAQALAAHGVFPFLARYDFETYFHRALLIAAALLLWPLLHVTHVRGMADLGLVSNHRCSRDVAAGAILSGIPLLCCGALLIALHAFSLRHSFAWTRLGKVILASISVPLIEEVFFRGIVLGILLRTGRKYLAIVAVSVLFAAVHFLKAPEGTSAVVTWTSGLNSIANAFGRFGDPVMVASAFATLFLIGCILADARVLTRSLWLPIGLHAGWIFGSGTFSLLARRQTLALPWLGKNLLVGLIPLAVATLTWLVMRTWIKHDRASKI